MNPLLTVKEVAGILRIHPNTVYQKAQSGKIPSVRTSNSRIRFIEKDVNQLVERRSRSSRSIPLFEEALRTEAKDGSFILVYLGDGKTPHRLELTWLRDRKEPYNLGDNEIHLAFAVDDYAAALARHKEMGVVCFENAGMGIYFIEDPDRYWLEIVPEKR